MAEEIGVGLIGYGMAARVFHAPVIGSVPALKLKKVVTRRGDEVRARHPSAEVVRDTADLLRDGAIELVVVATPNDTHFDLARQALSAGKHVVVEKPFTVTSNQAQRLIDLARRRGRVLGVHHNRRWDGDFLTVRALLGAKLLGRLVEYESHFDRFRNRPKAGAWREEDGEGSGVLYDLGPHLVDQALVLFGVPRAVNADVRTQRGFAKADDSFELVLDYDRLKVTLKAGMLVRGERPRFILHGTEGSFVKHGMDPQEEALKRGGSPSDSAWGEESHRLWGRLDTQLGGLHVAGRVETLAGRYQDYWANVADAIRNRAELAVKPEEARDVIRVIELALRSNRQRRTIPFPS